MATGLLLGSLVAGTVLKVGEDSEAADAQQNALQQQLKQERLRTQQQTINSLRATTNTLSKQDAAASVSGESLSSSSFSAIQLNTLKKFGEDQNAEALNLNFEEQANEQEQANAAAQGTANVFGDLFSTVSNVAENDLIPVGNKVPGFASRRSLIPLDI